MLAIRILYMHVVSRIMPLKSVHTLISVNNLYYMTKDIRDPDGISIVIQLILITIKKLP